MSGNKAQEQIFPQNTTNKRTWTLATSKKPTAIKGLMFRMTGKSMVSVREIAPTRKHVSLGRKHQTEEESKVKNTSAAPALLQVKIFSQCKVWGREAELTPNLHD